MIVKEMNIGEIKVYEKNPRYNDGAVDKVAKSIELYGWRSPIVVDKEMVIICGHTRLKAAQQLGLQTVPVTIADHLTPEQVKAYRIADNKLAEIAGWDYTLLAAEIESLQDSGLDLSLLDFEVVNMDQPEEPEKDGETDRDAIPEKEEDEPPKSRTGAVYQLGRHLLVCGDATKEDTWNLFGVTATARLLLTEVEVKSGKKSRDEEELEEDTRPVLEQAFRLAVQRMGSNAGYCVFYPDELMICVPETMESAGMTPELRLYWIKDGFIPGKRNYKLQTESCLAGRLDGSGFRLHGIGANNLLKHKRAKKHKKFPHYQPSEMLTRILKDSSASGEVVLDPFAGFGSTLLACEVTGRQCLTIELQPENVDLIRRRWAEFLHGEGCDWEQLTPEKHNEQLGMVEEFEH